MPSPRAATGPQRGMGVTSTARAIRRTGLAGSRLEGDRARVATAFTLTRSIDGHTGREQCSLAAELRPDQEDHRHSQSDRDSAAIVRRVPAGRCLPEGRKEPGLQGVFKSVFPIKDFNETASLEFVSYSLGEPKYDVEECHERGMTYAAPLKVTIQLVIWDVDPEIGVRSIKNVKEQEVYFGEIPLMTANGTFMVNGTERVIVSPAASFARRLLRPRQGQDARLRKAALLGAHHPVSRLVDRLRVRPARHPVRPHRPPPQVPRDDAAARPRHDAPRTCSTTSTRRTSSSSTIARWRRCSSRTSWSASRPPATSAIRRPTS